ncbi:hypothetical protein M5689_008407 [Euphorbia peplus]|nr:hypothetical protein M5689_008407 [Euphorbia peplus]
MSQREISKRYGLYIGGKLQCKYCSQDFPVDSLRLAFHIAHEPLKGAEGCIMTNRRATAHARWKLRLPAFDEKKLEELFPAKKLPTPYEFIHGTQPLTPYSSPEADLPPEEPTSTARKRTRIEEINELIISGEFDLIVGGASGTSKLAASGSSKLAASGSSKSPQAGEGMGQVLLDDVKGKREIAEMLNFLQGFLAKNPLSEKNVLVLKAEVEALVSKALDMVPNK